MADHAQQQILAAVKAALVAGGIVAADRVHLDRTDELVQTELPAVDILGGDEVGEESIQYQTISHPVVQQRAYTFAIASVAAGDTGAARSARNLAKQVETALMSSATAITVGARAIDMLLSESVERKDNSKALPMVAVRQTWQAQYTTLAGAPDVPV